VTNVKGDIAVAGLAVMGQNLILNIADHGFTVIAYNRTASKVDEFMAGQALGKNVVAAHTIQEMAGLLAKPRKIMLMIKAGRAVDDFIELLIPSLEPGDCIIDGGNSHYNDTMRRAKYLEGKGLIYVGCGVSGGEEGARHGPSLMPGGSAAAWPLVKNIFTAICARTPDGSPCCEWMGENGAGHFVKMTHNGIEYGDLQCIAEAYHIMRDGFGMSLPDIASVFTEWNKGELNSYLVEITAKLLTAKDANGKFLIDAILDVTGQKGTGKWTSVSSLELGVPVTLIAESILSRDLSALKEERSLAVKMLKGPKKKMSSGNGDSVSNLQKALFASKIVSYCQGFMLLRKASEEYRWNLDLGKTALVWRAGCIIRSAFLDRIKAAYDKNQGLKSLFLDDYFKSALDKCQDGWRKTVAAAVEAGIPVPAMSSGIAFYDGFRCNSLPASLIQAQRDYFGAHAYERIDMPRGRFFHNDWTGRGGEIEAGSYNA
jgi:6-phosphogluconate dehydrogenase